MISVQVLGVPQVLARFAAAAAAAEKAVQVGSEVAGQEVLGAAESLVPVDTGALRDSLEVTHDTDGAVLVGTDIRYAVYVEYGTSDTAAQPFLRPAADQADLPGAVSDVMDL